MKPANDNRRCTDCGGQDLRWENDKGWLFHGVRYLRCQRCLNSVASHIPAWTWVMFAIALAAAVWGWISIS